MRRPHARRARRGRRGRAARRSPTSSARRKDAPRPGARDAARRRAAVTLGGGRRRRSRRCCRRTRSSSTRRSPGRGFFAGTRGAAPHDYLQVTGGAIGIGMPLATGAAIACPERKVVCLQADGSGMYTVQALWTQAREGLDVTTVILDNRSYAILKRELANVGAGEPAAKARDMMELDRPALDWVAWPAAWAWRPGAPGLWRSSAPARRRSALRGSVSDRPRAVIAPSPPWSVPQGADRGTEPLCYAAVTAA